MANAETEDEDLSFIRHNRLIGKKNSKKIIINGASSDQ